MQDDQICNIVCGALPKCGVSSLMRHHIDHAAHMEYIRSWGEYQIQAWEIVSSPGRNQLGGFLKSCRTCPRTSGALCVWG
jgi:hypothetical protein